MLLLLYGGYLAVFFLVTDWVEAMDREHPGPGAAVQP